MLQHVEASLLFLVFSMSLFICVFRFGLSELQLLCEQYSGNPEKDPGERERGAPPAREPAADPQQSLADAQFLELLRSMWEHEDGAGEDAGEAMRGTEGEGGDGSGDGESNEDVVNEDELNEIYEFAATQRKKGTEAEVSTESGEDEDEDGANVCPGAEVRDEGKQDVEMEKLTDMRRGPDVESIPGSNKNAGLDRSHSRLFSESCGEHTEPPQTQTRHFDRMNTPISRRTSSVSEVIDLSISPPPESGEPAGELFPVTGVSPGEAPGETPNQTLTSESPKAPSTSQLPAEDPKRWSTDTSASALSKTRHEDTPSLPKAELSPPTPSRSQPELIVLSDSSDDLDQDLPDDVPSRADVPRPAPRPPTSSPSRLSLRFAHNKTKEIAQVGLSPNKSNQTPGSVHLERSRSEQVGGESVLDGSAEVSWLIPATPEASTRTSSTQTSSSMRRTRLFPRSGSSSSSSISDNPKTASLSNSVGEPHREHPESSPALQGLASRSGLSKTALSDSVNLNDPNSTSEPCSSTPLLSDPRPRRLDPLGSPLLRDSEQRTQGRAGREGKLGSLRLSPSENPSEKESGRGPAEFQHCDTSGDQELSAEDKEPEETMTSKSQDSDEAMEEGLSFVFDEPPIAFDDSWGLGGAVPEQGPCFSLRLESSGDQTDPLEQCGLGETPSLPTASPPGRGAQRNLPDPGAPHNHSLPDAATWDSWKEGGDEDEEEADALPLPQRLGAVALAKRVSELRTPGNEVSAWLVVMR